MTPRTLASAGVLLLAVATAAFAQQEDGAHTRRVAVDTVIGWQDYPGADVDWPAQYVVDLFATAEVRRGWQVGFRPKLWRTRGEWEPLLDQLSIQTQFRKGSNWRIEAGRFPSPVGLGMTENRPDLNGGMIWWHRPYYMPLPSLGSYMPRVSLLSAVYPAGVLATTSSDRWDVRAAFVDRAPVQFWKAQPTSARASNVILGGGVTPRQGLRIGVAAALGTYASATATTPRESYFLSNIEGEYAFAYTRLSGEWTRARFDTPAGPRVSHGTTVQTQQTLTPRLFLHSRISVMTSQETAAASLQVVNRRYVSVDSAVGYRLDPTLTLRVGHTAIRAWSSNAYDHEVGLSLFWSRRWW